MKECVSRGAPVVFVAGMVGVLFLCYQYVDSIYVESYNHELRNLTGYTTQQLALEDVTCQTLRGNVTHYQDYCCGYEWLLDAVSVFANVLFIAGSSLSAIVAMQKKRVRFVAMAFLILVLGCYFNAHYNAELIPVRADNDAFEDVVCAAKEAKHFVRVPAALDITHSTIPKSMLLPDDIAFSSVLATFAVCTAFVMSAVGVNAFLSSEHSKGREYLTAQGERHSQRLLLLPGNNADGEREVASNHWKF